MLAAIREVQVPLLAALLVGACLAKLARVLRARSVEAGIGPTALFPLRLQRPVAMMMCAAEMSLGVALIVTAGRQGAGVPATVVRGLTALLFVTAVGGLIELRQHRPDVGCGCFGDLSTTPVKLRTVVRSGLLALAAAVTIGAPPLHLPQPGGPLALRLGLLAAELVLIAALSPEIGETLVRLGYSEPCELRVLPAERTLAGLRGSRTWRRHAGVITSDQPVDVWRELCWRYLVYPGRYGGRNVEVVFAVYLRPRRPAVRAAVVDPVTGEVLPPLHLLPAPPVAGQQVRPLPPHAVGLWPTVTHPDTRTARPARAGRGGRAGVSWHGGHGAHAGHGGGVAYRGDTGYDGGTGYGERGGYGGGAGYGGHVQQPATAASGADGPSQPDGTPPFLAAPVFADSDPLPGSLYSLLALSSPVPRQRYNREDTAQVG